jgi:hypothetical protein
MNLEWETAISFVDERNSHLYILGNTTHTSETLLYILLHPELWVEIRDVFRDNLHFTLCHVTTIFIGTRRTVM